MFDARKSKIGHVRFSKIENRPCSIFQIENRPCPKSDTRRQALVKQALVKQALVKQALVKQALVKQALVKHFRSDPE